MSIEARVRFPDETTAEMNREAFMDKSLPNAMRFKYWGRRTMLEEDLAMAGRFSTMSCTGGALHGRTGNFERY